MCDINLCWQAWFGTPASLDYGICAMQNAGLAYVCVCVCVCVYMHACTHEPVYIP